LTSSDQSLRLTWRLFDLDGAYDLRLVKDRLIKGNISRS
jgi:hypothetical protein